MCKILLAELAVMSSENFYLISAQSMYFMTFLTILFRDASQEPNLNISTLTKLISGCLLATNVAFAGKCCICGEEYDGPDGDVCPQCRTPVAIIECDHCGESFLGDTFCDRFCPECQEGKQYGNITCNTCGRDFRGLVGLERKCFDCWFHDR